MAVLRHTGMFSTKTSISIHRCDHRCLKVCCSVRSCLVHLRRKTDVTGRWLLPRRPRPPDRQLLLGHSHTTCAWRTGYTPGPRFLPKSQMCFIQQAVLPRAARTPASAIPTVHSLNHARLANVSSLSTCGPHLSALWSPSPLVCWTLCLLTLTLTLPTHR